MPPSNHAGITNKALPSATPQSNWHDLGCIMCLMGVLWLPIYFLFVPPSKTMQGSQTKPGPQRPHNSTGMTRDEFVRYAKEKTQASSPSQPTISNPRPTQPVHFPPITTATAPNTGETVVLQVCACVCVCVCVCVCICVCEQVVIATLMLPYRPPTQRTEHAELLPLPTHSL